MKRQNQAGSALVIIVVGVLVVAVAGFALWRWWGATHPAQTNKDTTAGLTAGSDNASLDNDLSTINKSVNQEQTDADSANTALNDQQQEIAVPTE